MVCCARNAMNGGLLCRDDHESSNGQKCYLMYYSAQLNAGNGVNISVIGA